MFLITDGYSNGGDPRPAAEKLKQLGVEFYTFGIRNGNVRELYDMASEPREEHSFIVDSFEEFEALARRALHKDLGGSVYLAQGAEQCSAMCQGAGPCCDPAATCSCGAHNGFYSCICPPGHYGRGLRGDCHSECPVSSLRWPHLCDCRVPPRHVQAEPGAGGHAQLLAVPRAGPHLAPRQPLRGAVRVSRGLHQGGGRQLRAGGLPRPPAPRQRVLHPQRVQERAERCLRGPLQLWLPGTIATECKPEQRCVKPSRSPRLTPCVQLSGSSMRLCLPTGEWSGAAAECGVKTCREMAAPAHGYVACSSDNYAVDTVCEFG